MHRRRPRDGDGVRKEVTGIEMAVKKIGIVGGGVMGTGIAQVAALADFEVVLEDISAELTNKVIGTIRKNLQNLLSKGKIKREEADKALANVHGAKKLTDLDTCDIVIECIFENIDAKKKLFGELEQALPGHVIFASNTSSLSITELANSTKRPEKFVGMHFFNPVSRMRLVEVTRGAKTSDETVRVVKELAEKLGKVPIEVRDSPGFVVNRILIPMINEAAYALHDGVASAEDIDAAMKIGANHPMGPLELADLIGLDVVYEIMRSLYEEFGDPKYRPCPSLKKLVRAGYLGKKAGRGFHVY